ncbi:MAG: DUF4292 domain-containing protein [Bacteroidales bacterium]
MKILKLIVLICFGSQLLIAQKAPEGRRLLRKVIRNNVDYQRLNFKNCLFAVEYNGMELPEVKGNIKFVKDSAIQISVVPAFGIEAGRILITRDSVFVVNRINKWYLAESWESADMEGLKKLKMKELEDIFLGNLPSRSRWLIRRDSLYKINDKERAFRVNTGKSGWIVNLVVNNSGSELTGISAVNGTKNTAHLNYLRRYRENRKLNEVKLNGELVLEGLMVKGKITMKDPVEDTNFRIGAQVGRKYVRKSFSSLKGRK